MFLSPYLHLPGTPPTPPPPHPPTPRPAAGLVPKLKPCPLATFAQLCTCLTKFISERCHQRSSSSSRALRQRLDALAAEAVLMQPIMHQLMVAALSYLQRYSAPPLEEGASMGKADSRTGGKEGVEVGRMQEQDGASRAGRGEQVSANFQFIRAAAAAAASAGRALHVSSPCCVPAVWTTQAHLI
jgi:hypothetical protein